MIFDQNKKGNAIKVEINVDGNISITVQSEAESLDTIVKYLTEIMKWFNMINYHQSNDKSYA